MLITRPLLLPLLQISLAFLLLIPFEGTDAQGVCIHQGNRYRDGEEWTVFRSFIMRCTVYYNRWETKIIACLSMMGERIPVHGQITDRHGTWKCVQEENGSTRLVQEK